MTDSDPHPKRKRWPMVVAGLVALFFVLAFFFFKDDALRDHSDLARSERPAIDGGDATFAAWLDAVRKIDNDSLDEATKGGKARLFFDQLSGSAPWDPAPVEKIVAANRDAIDAAIHADTLGPIAMPEVPDIATSVPYFGGLQRMSKLLRICSAERYIAGDYQAAADLALVNLRFADHLVEDPNMLISHLVAISCQAISYAAIDRLAADGSPDAILVDLDEALAEGPDVIASLERALRNEFAIFAHSVRRIEELDAGGRLFAGNGPPQILLKKNRTINDGADDYRVLIANCRRAPADRVDLPVRKIGRLSSNAYGNFLSGQMGELGQVVSKADTLISSRRTLRAKVALLRFRQDEGALPARLSDLVPKYLAAVPLDPHDGAPLRYDPARGAVWVIGGDLTDTGGSSAPDRNGFGSKAADPTRFVLPLKPTPSP